jgi:hypothetical protein
MVRERHGFTAQTRADLRQAGLGTGYHAFRATLPFGFTGPLEIRRAADEAEFPLDESRPRASRLNSDPRGGTCYEIMPANKFVNSGRY